MPDSAHRTRPYPDLPRNLRSALSVLLVHPPGADAGIIISQLDRLNADVASLWPWSGPLPPADLAVVFTEAARREQTGDMLHAFDGAIVASVDPHEKGVIDSLLAVGVHALLVRPLRIDTIISQIAMAQAIHAQQSSLQRKQAHLEERLRMRRTIEKAVAIVTHRLELAPDQAYGHLRKFAMEKRQSLEAVARGIVDGE
ncbi:ANTAR domain-containing response regulator [Rhizobium puerariae]|uniref:ANTAR domain-containing response regulator n=1 Tax=Rhizobium puerariae TaxID=1585791 RepID=A0ABV6AKT6_9HYPH